MKLRLLCCAVLAFGLAACSSFATDDPAATLRAEREGYVLEATAIADSALAQRTQVLETAAAAQTRVGQIEAANTLLLATLRAAVPPTQQIISDTGVVTPGQVATPAPLGAEQAVTALPGAGDVPAGSQFVETITALSVRASDGCVDVAMTNFAADIGRIYIVTRAQTIAGGTVMRVEWAYQGTPTFSEEFTVSSSSENYCLWFYIEPTADVLSAGDWSVQLFADGVPIQPQVAFTVGM